MKIDIKFNKSNKEVLMYVIVASVIAYFIIPITLHFAFGYLAGCVGVAIQNHKEKRAMETLKNEIEALTQT